MKILSALLLICTAFSTVAMARTSASAPITYGDIMEVTRSIVRQGWSVDFYETKDSYGDPREQIFIRQGDGVCLVPDFSYLDSVGVPREIDILPMSGAGGVVTKTATVTDGSEIWWHEGAAWHGDYGSNARTGSYVVDDKGRVISAELNSWTLTYSYDVPPVPQGSIPSCEDLRLPKK